MGEFAGQQVVVGVSGGIAAYKTADLVSKLVQGGAAVRVVMTRHATEFVTPLTFQALSGNPVLTETFAAPEAYGMGHLSLARWATALVVAPATANILAKAACGLADDLLSTTLVSLRCPSLLAPAMNAAMWDNVIVQRNVATLRAAGHRFVGPGHGWLACREEGAGRMAEVPELLAALRAALWTARDLAGRRVLITAGPTREHVDPVRYLSNPSTGRQGFALAEAAAMRGADVTLVSGPTDLPDPPGVEVVRVRSAADMAEAVAARCGEADLVIGAAAVSDYTPAAPLDHKAPKPTGSFSLELQPTPDIIATVAAGRRPGQVVVGFAAETHDLLAHAADKLRRKQLDLVVANQVGDGQGFGTADNAVTLVYPDREPEVLPGMTKLEVGHAVLQRAAALLAEKAAR